MITSFDDLDFSFPLGAREKVSNHRGENMRGPRWFFLKSRNLDLGIDPGERMLSRQKSSPGPEDAQDPLPFLLGAPKLSLGQNPFLPPGSGGGRGRGQCHEMNGKGWREAWPLWGPPGRRMFGDAREFHPRDVPS